MDRALLVLAGLLCAYPAGAHDAPLGWAYPLTCCSGIDCRQVHWTAVVEGARGYEIVATHELIPMDDARIKDSPDGEFHVCSVEGSDKGATICLFVPSRGM